MGNLLVTLPGKLTSRSLRHSRRYRGQPGALPELSEIVPATGENHLGKYSRVESPSHGSQVRDSGAVVAEE